MGYHEMPATEPVRRRFRIERLEERVTPGCLFFPDAASDGIATAWATGNGAESQEAVQSSITQSAILPRSAAARDTTPGSASEAKDRNGFPAWADKFLQDIEQRFNGHSKTKADAGTQPATNESQATDNNSSSASPVKDRLGFPAWAEKLLVEVEQRLGWAPKPEIASGSECQEDQSGRLDEVMAFVNQEPAARR